MRRVLQLMAMTSTVLAGAMHMHDAGKVVNHGLIINTVKAPAIVEPVDHFGDDDVVHSIRHLHNIRPEGHASGRGPAYVAARNISKGDTIVSLPLASAMSAKTAAEGRIQALLLANPDLPNAVVLALHVLEEKFKGADSKWFSFLRALPKTLHGTIYLPNDEIDLIEGSQLHRLTQARLEAVSTFYDALHGPLTSNAMDPPLFRELDFTLESFKWALSIVWAHAILVPKSQADPADMEALLVPMVSTMGHSATVRNHFDVNHDTQTFAMVATQHFGVGDPVVINLGDNSMTLYMLNYGFCGDPSPFDMLPMAIQVEASDPLLKFKTSILEMVNSTMETPYELRLDAPLPPSMLQSMRIKVMTSPEIGAYEAAVRMERIGLRNEYALSKALLRTTGAMLDAYAYPLDEMRRVLRTLEGRSRDLARTVIHEQEILTATMAAVREHWHGLLLDAAFVPT
ncbi:hypothetical protein SPRG_09498 [Saprolegnia parasitica CBS 223.65]|uniref:Rubisco LSMT substrate-binding domain-containing protein n=1 Tax=Saprolegnia parasitica (strain CBS 223.65) TaxID=695850 RepID=A0A067C7Y2_SAPPC|nr:hypothetical protein SPRG_09498 [Saprolegnia parasitica CBS 223.65]KDO25250.1 hypothetical protein SPRG_09498 [Saprolegnia parasitica CBS 223.65]|eukprot:XP_012204083.1 hypothetical protein SPRG_09498 [Saprolegnia parasitica CBS 223.65]